MKYQRNIFLYLGIFGLVLQSLLFSVYAWFHIEDPAINEVHGLAPQTVQVYKYKKIGEQKTTEPVEDAKFLLYQKVDGQKRQIGLEYRTDQEGKLSFLLKKGQYCIEEIEPPIGYNWDRDEEGNVLREYEFEVEEVPSDETETIELSPIYNPISNGQLKLHLSVFNEDGSELTTDQCLEEFYFTIQFSDNKQYSYQKGKEDNNAIHQEEVATNIIDRKQSFVSVQSWLNKKERTQESTETEETSKVEVTLRAGEYILFEPLPRGLSYEITQKAQGNYRVTSTNDKGTIEADTLTDASFHNMFPVEEKGSLVISKKVIGTEQSEVAFPFVLEIGGETHEFTLRDGEEKEFTQLIPETSYTVYEKTEEMDQGYTPTIERYQGKIQSGERIALAFMNEYKEGEPDPDPSEPSNPEPSEPSSPDPSGPSNPDPSDPTKPEEKRYNLVVRKEWEKGMTDGEGDQRRFTFQISFSGEKAPPSPQIFKLKVGEEKEWIGLCEGVSYEIEEIDSLDYEPVEKKIRGTIQDRNQVVIAYNKKGKYEGSKEVALHVTKEIWSDTELPSGEKERSFPFVLEYRETKLPFSLKDGETRTFYLPQNVAYTIKELENPIGYRTQYSNAFGITSQKDTYAKIRNVYEQDVHTIMKTIKGEKIWKVSEEDQEKIPKSIEIRLKSGDHIIERKRIKPNKENRWLYQFEVPKYDEQNQEILYEIEEEELPHFYAVYKENKVINRLYGKQKIELPVFEKIIQGFPSKEDTFVFQLVAKKNAPLPEGAEEQQYEWKHKGGGKVNIPAIPFEQTGYFEYILREVDLEDGQYVYDKTEYHLLVKISNQGKKLVPSYFVYKKRSDLPEKEIKFVNHYIDPEDRESGAGGSNSGNKDKENHSNGKTDNDNIGKNDAQDDNNFNQDMMETYQEKGSQQEGIQEEIEVGGKQSGIGKKGITKTGMYPIALMWSISLIGSITIMSILYVRKNKKDKTGR